MIWILGFLAGCAFFALPALGFGRLLAWGASHSHAAAGGQGGSRRPEGPDEGFQGLAALLAGFARFM